MNRVKKWLLTSIILATLFSVSLAIIYYNRHDAFVYVSMLWVLACIVVMFISKPNVQLWALYTGTTILTLGLYEAYLAGWFSEQSPKLINFSISNPAYFQTHNILGTVPKKDIQVTAQKSYGNELLYNVQYTIDQNGLRLGFNQSKKPPMNSVLFFGGSFTFGEGVNDNETMPYRFEEKGRFKAFNFGFHGYGPHQMLATLENEMEKAIVSDTHPKYAVYQAIPSHVDRCAGRAWWDQSGPQYRLNEKGEAIYQGPFQNFLMSSFITVMTRSNVVRKRLSSSAKATSIADIDLFVNIVNKSKSLFEKRYGGQFYVLLWPSDYRLYQAILSKLKTKQIVVIKIEDILSDIEKYRIRFSYENHPNQLAHDKIATYILKFLQEK